MSDKADEMSNSGSAKATDGAPSHYSTEKWLRSLPTVRLAKARKLISDGAQLKIFLDERSDAEGVIWRATILNPEGRYFALSGTDLSKPRKLTSVQLVYQVARNLSVPDVKIPVLNL